MPRRRLLRRPFGAIAAMVALSAGIAAAADADRQRLRESAMSTYVHGITADLARERIGEAGVPALAEWLSDPSFPRPDNLVAFLAHLGGDEAIASLRAYLEASPGTTSTPEIERALLTVPHAFAEHARRGGERALVELIALLDSPEGARRLERAASRGAHAQRRLRNLAEQTVIALSEADDPRALDLLRRLSVDGWRFRPGVDLAPTARDVTSGRPYASPVRTDRGAPAVAGAGVVPELDRRAEDSSTPSPHALDPGPTAHRHRITWANHADVTSPLVAPAQANALLVGADRILARSAFDADVACCTALRASGDARTFYGDGLDTVNNEQELIEVILNPVARVKIVQFIRWCGGPGFNILGCALTPGDGMVVVRTGDAIEGALWAHEYGHNLGLPHRAEPDYLMYPTFGVGSPQGLDATECEAFHVPPLESDASVEAAGACVHDDDDELAPPADNCSYVPNPDQIDRDEDGFGDACDVCPVTHDPDQADRDSDGRGDRCDSCPDTPDPVWIDSDGDLLPDACDPCEGPDRDDDGDLLCAPDDNCPNRFNPDQEDLDGDGLGDLCDLCPLDPVNDPDGDGRCAAEDACPSVPTGIEATWTFPIAVSWIGGADFDGDGRNEIVFPLENWSQPQGGTVEIRSFRGSGLRVVRRLPRPPSFTGFEVADLNGDGYADLLGGVWTWSPPDLPGDSQGALRYWSGGPSGIASTPTSSLSFGVRYHEFGRWISAGGDANGDGIEDAIASRNDTALNASFPIYIVPVLGAVGGLVEPISSIPPPADGSAPPHGFGFVGDLDGDGFDEIAELSRRQLSPRETDGPRLRVLRGSPAGPESVSTWEMMPILRFDAAGDVNGDGFDDLVVVRDESRGQAVQLRRRVVELHTGSPAGPQRTWRFEGGPESAGNDPFPVGVGDVNGDGFSDVAVGIVGGVVDRIHLFFGSPAGLPRIPSRTLSRTTTDSGMYFHDVFHVGDLDGDGFDELAVHARTTSGWPPGPSQVLVFRGGPDGPVPLPDDPDGDGLGNDCDPDDDGDGVEDAVDNCPAVSNATQADGNADGVGDACDSDGDGVRDAADNCPSVSNLAQEDANLDGVGDACDSDSDGVPDAEDLCPSVADSWNTDSDGDGFGDVCDPDRDGDGVPDAVDRCPDAPDSTQADSDGDGLGDACDPCFDRDGDTFGVSAPGTCFRRALDCDDADPEVRPGVIDLCDGRDDDCNGVADDAQCERFDADGDGRVDGSELIRLGRAWALCSARPERSWWARVNYVEDACVDGLDLSVLGAVWNCRSEQALCVGGSR